LYRLSRSSHAGKFILKGALMLLVWEARAARSTMDIDMLGRMKNNPEAVIDMVREICRQEVEPYGVVFDPDSVRGERITEDADYEGVRVRFRGALDTARIAIQLDVGFGDVVVPPKNMESRRPASPFPGSRRTQSSANIWFTEERNLEVTVLIDAQVSHYFKRRKMFPTQEIREERPDGSLVVSFRMSQYEAIRNILKSWIPHIVILEPEEFKKDLLEDVRRWIRKQGKL